MNKTLALVLVLALVLGGVLTLVFSGGQEGRGGEQAAPASGATEPAKAESADLVEPTGLAVAESESPARTEATVDPERVAAAAVGNSENFATDGARWADVHVVLPPGVPEDDDLALLSFSYSDGDELDQWDRRQISQAVDLTGEFAEEIDNDLVWARRELSASGTVRMPFYGDADEGMVLLQSRYVYADVETVQLDAETAEVTIEGELGAYVTGVCLIPAGAEDRGIEPDDIDIELDGRAREGGLGFGMEDSREPRIRADFTFEMRALSANKKYAVQAEAERLVDYFEISFTAEAGEHTRLEIPFELGGEIRGIVVTDTGQPLPEVEIEAESNGFLFGENEEEAETAEDGTFVLSGIAAGEVELRVRAEGWREPELEPLEIADGETIADYRIVLERGNSIAGVVRWADGTPAENADVEAFVIARQGWPREVGEAESDADGAFTITGLGDGPFELRAEANPDPNRRPSHRHEVDSILAAIPDAPEFEFIETEVATPERSESNVGGDSDWVAVLTGVAANANVELTLAEPLILSGFVRDDTGKPVESEFVIEARPAGTSEWGSRDEVDDDFVSADGSFHLQGVFPGEWMVTAEAEGYTTPAEPVAVTIPLGAPVELLLLRGAAVAGRVVDPFGNEVPDASVTARKGGQGNPFDFGGMDDTETDAEGRFELEGLSAEGITLVADHSDWAASEELVVETEAGGGVGDVVLQLRVGAVITGEVFDEEGEPDSGQNVGISAQGFSFGMGGENSVVTDSGGRFRFEHVTPGKVVLTAMPKEEDIIDALQEAGGDETAMMNFMGQMRMQSVEVKDGEEVHVVLGAKPKDPVTVTGRVIEAGNPVGEAQLVVVEEGGALVTGMKATKTDAEGRYEVVLDRPGDFVFNVDLNGESNGMGIPFFVDVPEQPEFRKDLVVPLGKISGAVYGPDGKPASGVSIKVSQMGGVFGLEDLNMMSNASTSADGTYEFAHLSPGKYFLQVGGAGTFFSGDAEKYGAVVVDDIAVDESEHVSGVDVHLSSPGKLSGTVRDKAGQPVGGATIFVRDSKGRPVQNISITMTDAAGRFTYEGIAPGAVTVCARTDDMASADAGP